MEVADPERLSGRPPALLVSLHDVSPLTLEACQEALALLRAAGLEDEQLTVLAIPRHEAGAAIDEHPATARFLRELADAGARLVMHGLTHRMDGRAWTPGGFFQAHLFARGQGELYRAGAAEVARRLAEGAEILTRAGLAPATRAFVPPAWLLSPEARQVVGASGFEFYELFGGLVSRGRLLARRVIGWGSLNGIEAAGTALYAGLQSRLPPADTRLAIHPADMRRPGQRRAITSALARLLPRMRPMNYSAYLSTWGPSKGPQTPPR
jgi:predicted deacetylase